MLKIFPNLYYAFGKQQKQIKKLAKTEPFNPQNKRPSTGAWTLEFLVKNIDFKYISLFGFDFFDEFVNKQPNYTMNYGRNLFNSQLSQKHDPVAEKEYFENIISNYDIRYY